jgi:hypothetical protein
MNTELRGAGFAYVRCKHLQGGRFLVRVLLLGVPLTPGAGDDARISAFEPHAASVAVPRP